MKHPGKSLIVCAHSVRARSPHILFTPLLLIALGCDVETEPLTACPPAPLRADPNTPCSFEGECIYNEPRGLGIDDPRDAIETNYCTELSCSCGKDGTLSCRTNLP